MAGKVPNAEEVTSYLKKHQIEAVIEDAVNDAVLNQVSEPFKHIADLLTQHSEKVAGKERRVSIGDADTSLQKAGRKAGFKEETVKDSVTTEETSLKGGPAATGEELQRSFTKKEEIALKPSLEQMLKSFFDKMDLDGDGSVTKEEAVKFWGTNFAKVNATAMFNEVDEDGNESIDWHEFVAFWKNVVGSGYSEEDLEEEVEMMLEGGSWVDFNDGRTT